MNGKYRCYLIFLVAVVLLAALPVVTVWAECPPGSKVYIGGPVTKSTAVRGSQENPAKDLDEAFDICQECPNGVYIYEYNTTKAKYAYRGRCVPEESEPTGVPLAQSVGMVLLGLLAVGLLAWGIHLRIKLRQFQSGS